MSENNDTISRSEALAAFGLSEKTRKYGGDHSGYDTRMLYEIQDVLENLPPTKETQALPDREVIDDCLFHIKKNVSVHLSSWGVVEVNHYIEKLYEEIYGEGERPYWMKE